MSFDSVEDQQAFAEKENFPYLLLSDPDRTAGAAYDAVRQEGDPGFEKTSGEARQDIRHDTFVHQQRLQRVAHRVLLYLELNAMSAAISRSASLSM